MASRGRRFLTEAHLAKKYKRDEGHSLSLNDPREEVSGHQIGTWVHEVHRTQHVMVDLA